MQAFTDRLSRRSPVAVAENEGDMARASKPGLTQALAIEMGATIRCFADAGTERALTDYAAMLEQDVMQAPYDQPTDMAALMTRMESENITQHFFTDSER